MAGHPSDPRLIREIGPRFAPRLNKALGKIGLFWDVKYATARPGELGVMSTYIELVKKIKNLLDPDGIMHPGAWEGI